jgi:hypothetical protein
VLFGYPYHIQTRLYPFCLTKYSTAKIPSTTYELGEFPAESLLSTGLGWSGLRKDESHIGENSEGGSTLSPPSISDAKAA